jgi:hypothetical protein
LFGTFPHPPTIPGADGQRIFNATTRSYDARDGLFRLLTRLMPNGRAPTLSDVRAEAEGLDNEVVEEVRVKIDRMYQGQVRSLGSNPWLAARKELGFQREMQDRT